MLSYVDDSFTSLITSALQDLAEADAHLHPSVLLFWPPREATEEPRCSRSHILWARQVG